MHHANFQDHMTSGTEEMILKGAWRPPWSFQMKFGFDWSTKMMNDADRWTPSSQVSKCPV